MNSLIVAGLVCFGLLSDGGFLPHRRKAFRTVAVLDDFNRANGGLGANWTDLFLDTISISSSAATGPAGQNALARWNVTNFGTDHWARVTITAITAGDNCGPAVRCALATATAYMYHSGGSSNPRLLYRVVAGAFTALDTGISGTTAVNDVLTIAVSGTGATVTIRMYRNGSLDTTMGGGDGIFLDTDVARLTAGDFAGMGIYSNGDKMDDFNGGSGLPP